MFWLKQILSLGEFKHKIYNQYQQIAERYTIGEKPKAGEATSKQVTWVSGRQEGAGEELHRKADVEVLSLSLEHFLICHRFSRAPADKQLSCSVSNWHKECPVLHNRVILCGLWTGSISVTWELIRNAGYWALTLTSWPRICIFQDPQVIHLLNKFVKYVQLAEWSLVLFPGSFTLFLFLKTRSPEWTSDSCNLKDFLLTKGRNNFPRKSCIKLERFWKWVWAWEIVEMTVPFIWCWSYRDKALQISLVQWFSKCDPWTVSFSMTWEYVLAMEVPRPQYRPTESDTLEVGFRDLCLKKPSQRCWCMPALENHCANSLVLFHVLSHFWNDWTNDSVVPLIRILTG